ncbi:cytochrome P450 3A41-like [Patiria miniata]|uniref:Thromboxane-A synthase n=1 Tax=Patiria miniata TaxID=46514 RepID=A0A914ASP0_PATMI|nr:cytochrome P450 3A41-like [Patiria miniata]
MYITEEQRAAHKEGVVFKKTRVDLLQLMLNAHNDPEVDQEDTPSSDKAKGKGVVQRKLLSTEDVMAQSLTFFLAGYETTNTLLGFTAYLLATNQDTQEKLHAEIDNLAPTRDNLGYDVISKMEYLDMVINESLRMYPPAVMFSPENKASIKPCTFMPFGLGPRNCIGMRFALLEAKMALVRVMQQYRFDVCSETEIPPTVGKAGLMSPKNINLKAIPRN